MTNIRIFRYRIDPKLVKREDIVMNTGMFLTTVIDTIRKEAMKGPVRIFLHECENMVHFRAILKDNFPNIKVYKVLK